MNKTELFIQLEQLSDTAKELGATKGAQRLLTIKKYYKKFSLEEAYRLIDPSALQQEVEEAQSRSLLLKAMYLLRIAFSLIPLILTWIALYYATNDYQQYLQKHPSEVYIPFLKLWQDGFDGITQFTFARVALLDAGLLFLFLLVSLAILFFENHIGKKNKDFVMTLEKVTEGMLNLVDLEGITSFTSDKDIDKIAQAMSYGININVQTSREILESAREAVNIAKKIMEEALDKAKQMMDEVVTQSNKKVEELFNNEIKTMIDRFRDDLSLLHENLQQLEEYMEKLGSDVHSHDEHLEELSRASSLLAIASSDLASNTGKIVTSTNQVTTFNEDTYKQVIQLNSTQQQFLSTLVASQQQLIAQMDSMVGNMKFTMQEAQGASSELYQSAKAEIQLLTQGFTEVADQTNKVVAGLSQVSTVLSQTDTPLIRATADLKDTTQLLTNSQEFTNAREALTQLTFQLEKIVRELQELSQIVINSRSGAEEKLLNPAQLDDGSSKSHPTLWNRLRGR